MITYLCSQLCVTFCQVKSRIIILSRSPIKPVSSAPRTRPTMFGVEATTKPLSEKPVLGTQSPRPLLTPFRLEPTMRVSNTPDPWSLTNTMSTVGKAPAPNTTAPPHVGKPPPLPTFEPSDKELASNTTDPRATYYNKLLHMFTFNPDSKQLASNTSLFHINPFKPMNDWKPFNMPDFKPKLRPRTPAPPKAPASGPLVIAKAIAGISGCIVILILIFCCIYSKRINRPRGERKPRRNKTWQWFYDSEPIDFGDSPRYSYTNHEVAESQDYQQEIDVAVESGPDLSFDLNCYDNDTGGASNDCAQD